MEFQKIATQTLRDGLLAYDQRRGWRGPVGNVVYSKDWYQNLEKKYKLEKSIGWSLAIVKKVDQFNANIETENKLQGIIEYKDISWTK